MLQLGFSEEWVSLVMKCVNSVTFQVKVNGELLPSFRPSKGIRQGDPISPYLFLLCGEGLSCLLKNYDGGWVDKGIRPGLRALWITHLLFADDCLVFLKADSRSAHHLNEILQAYGVGSGQCVNKAKSSVIFSPKCGASVRVGVRNALQIHREALDEKYLGLPTAAGRLTENNFIHVREQARSRVQGYCEKLLSCAAKEVLLKSVIQALPAYSMSCFKLTRGLCKKIMAIMSKFWWE